MAKTWQFFSDSSQSEFEDYLRARHFEYDVAFYRVTVYEPDEAVERLVETLGAELCN